MPSAIKISMTRNRNLKSIPGHACQPCRCAYIIPHTSQYSYALLLIYVQYVSEPTGTACPLSEGKSRTMWCLCWFQMTYSALVQRAEKSQFCPGKLLAFQFIIYQRTQKCFHADIPYAEQMKIIIYLEIFILFFTWHVIYCIILICLSRELPLLLRKYTKFRYTY